MSAGTIETPWVASASDDASSEGTSGFGQGDAGAPPTPSFSFEHLESRLLFDDDPLAVLKEIVGDIQTREARMEHEQLTLPVERYLARRLTEAGLFGGADEEELPPCGIVVLRRSRLFYVRMEAEALAYGSYLRIVRLESVLNALRLAHEHYGDLATVAEADLYRFEQRVTGSICGQAPSVDMADWSYLAMPWQNAYAPSVGGEWAARHNISEAIEEVRLPYRLTASFRTNVAEGNAAIVFDAMPAQAFPRTAYAQGLGVVPTTSAMRDREASAYAARLGLLLAACAFHASERIRRVWVAAVHDTPRKHTCLYSVCLERRAFSHLRLHAVHDPLATMHSLGATMLEHDGVLEHSAPCFYLEDQAFCPAKRHDLWELSERVLPPVAAPSLGTTHVWGLTIHEELPRVVATDRIAEHLHGPVGNASAEDVVRAALDVMQHTSDIAVWEATERLVHDVIDGTLTPYDAEDLRRAMVGKTDVAKAVDQAQHMLLEHRAYEALTLLQGALAPLDRRGRYEDTSAVAYRCFDNFTERVLYNRMHAHDGRLVSLVPDSYVMAHLMASSILLSPPTKTERSTRQSLVHARRALAVAPLSAAANLNIATCLEQAGELEDAQRQLCSFLEVAFYPQSISMAYYQLAGLFVLKRSDELAQACYQRCVRVTPGFLPYVMVAFQTHVADGHHFVESMDPRHVDAVLEDAGVPLAPTPRMSYYLMDGARAAIDAEVFPVARELMRVVEVFTGDDVMHGIRASLEREPDV